MILSEIGQTVNEIEINEYENIHPDTNYDFLSHRKNYTEQQMKLSRVLKRYAQTAKAAFLIKGLTVHSLFEIRQIKKKEVNSPLNRKKLQELQRKFKGITHIIIDGYSMLSQAVLGIIDKRLRDATGKQSEYFGGVSI
ncbi:unnamed protein product [Brachionus calyciflorus]|uniref:ATP-dependent DNA helicase n=1 Tax=Brachionus calyciflorus TaxID=104777 RepID=A0A814B4Y4_9BILA|nr:unnamed protein product [Brachionus calyciflorus]